MIVRVKTWFAHIHAFTCVLAHAYAQNTRVIVHGGGPIISVWIIRRLKWLSEPSRAEHAWREEKCQADTFAVESQTFSALKFGKHPFPRVDTLRLSLPDRAEAASRLWAWINISLSKSLWREDANLPYTSKNIFPSHLVPKWQWINVSVIVNRDEWVLHWACMMRVFRLITYSRTSETQM